MKLSYKTVFSVLGVIALIVQSLGVKVDGALVNEIITGVSALLVAIGLVSPKEKENKNTENK